MALEVGSIVEGRVTGITKFGAFVALPDGKSGLVHISEIANSFVSDVHEFVEMGQTVKVRVLSISEEGKINLSIKRAVSEPPKSEARPRRQEQPPMPSQVYVRPTPVATETSGNQDFEDRLKKFMQESDSRIADSRMYADHRQRRRSR